MAVHTDVSPAQPYEKKCLLRSVQIYGVLIAWHVKRRGLAALIGRRTTGSLSDCKNLAADWGRAACPVCHMTGGQEPGECCPWRSATPCPTQRLGREGTRKDISGYMFSSFFFFRFFILPVVVAANLVTRWMAMEERIFHSIIIRILSKQKQNVLSYSKF